MSKKSKKIQYIVLVIIGIIFLFFTYLTLTKTKPIVENLFEENIWVTMNPIQCLGNPWEFDWLKKNKNQYSQYPIDIPNKIDTKEIEIIKKFYINKEIDIWDIKSTPINDTICTTCSCPQGYKLYVLVSKKDAKKMIKMGWKINN